MVVSEGSPLHIMSNTIALAHVELLDGKTTEELSMWLMCRTEVCYESVTYSLVCIGGVCRNFAEFACCARALQGGCLRREMMDCIIEAPRRVWGSVMHLVNRPMMRVRLIQRQGDQLILHHVLLECSRAAAQQPHKGGSLKLRNLGRANRFTVILLRRDT